MNRILLSLTLLIISGCTGASPNSQNATASSSKKCLDKPEVVLDTNNVKTIDLGSKTLTESGIINQNKSLGYSFLAEAGQKLVYQTNPDVCIWVYTPDNQLLNSSVLPINGKYIIQIAVPKGSTTFDLVMNLKSATDASVPFPTIKPTPVITNISRPSPEKVIEDYYAKINSHRYRDAWNIFPVSIQEDKTLHPDGYNSFLKWWNTVDFVYVRKVTLAESNNNSATVKFWSNYHMKSGVKDPISLNFYMTWNETNQSWDISQINNL